MIEEQGWRALTLEEVARCAHVAPESVRELYADKAALLRGIARHVDGLCLSGYAPEAGASAHDRLFEALMGRFDALQRHRGAFLAMLGEARRDPVLLRWIVCALRDSMRETLRCAGLDRHDTARQALILSVLEGIYLLALRVWARDQSLDMAKTMAALDRYVSFAEKAATALRIA